MTEQASAQQPPTGDAADEPERPPRRRGVKPTITRAIARGVCLALFLVIVECFFESERLGARVMTMALVGLIAGVMMEAGNALWEAMHWPEWGLKIAGLAVLGGLVGAPGRRSSTGVIVHVIAGAIIGAAIGTIIELDLGMRLIRGTGRLLGLGPSADSRSPSDR